VFATSDILEGKHPHLKLPN